VSATHANAQTVLKILVEVEKLRRGFDGLTFKKFLDVEGHVERMMELYDELPEGWRVAAAEIADLESSLKE
jgi:hypothetical protein